MLRGLAVLGPRRFPCRLPDSPPLPEGPVTTETLQHVALFDKCKSFTKAREVQASGLHAWYKPISRSEDTVVVIEGKERIMMGSNNYLGLTHHPEVLAAAKQALERYGSGCTGSRLLNGTLDLHEQLEVELAQFFGKEACLVFSTGYQANLGVVSGLVGRGDLVFLDKLDHASIVDGAKMSYGETIRFNHGDLSGLERKLQRVPAGTGLMIIVDGVYSMEGDIADVPGLLKIAQKYGAALVLDDAHAVGVLGPRGDGTAAHFGLTDDVDLIVGTFSKSLASIGGFAAAAESVIHFLKHNSRPMIFTAALPPANTAGVLAALHLLQREPERRERLWENTRRLQERNPSWSRRVFSHRRSRRSGSRCSRCSAARTPAVLAGGSAAVKIIGRELCFRKWMTLSAAAANPPIDASDLENVPTMRSTSSVRPKCAAVPSPRGPSTPTAWASSSTRAAPYFCAILSRPGTSAMSPSIEYTPSTMIIKPVPAGTRCSLRSRPDRSPWLNRIVSP